MAYKVLLPEGSSRQVLPMAKGFKELGCVVTTVQEKKSDLGSVTRYADQKIVIDGIDSDLEVASKEYKRLIEREHFDLVVPLSDFSAGIFSELKEHAETVLGTKVATNERKVFMDAFDKLNTMKICMAHDIPCPYTIDEVFSIDDVPVDLPYPAIIKPRSACGSIGLHIAQNRDELAKYIEQSRTDGLGNILVQEFIPQSGKQYNGHFVLDADHNVKTAIIAEKCRWFPIDGGASTLCRTIYNEHILSICAKLLKTIGWVGYCDIDLMEDPRDGSIRVIEINARISANVKLCFESGANIAKQLLQLYTGEAVDECLEYSEDVRLRCMHTDLLWFLKSPKRFHTDPNWFSSRNTTDQIFSWKDLPVFFTFSFQGLFKYKKEMKKRER